ncbi:MAG: class I SAM-dependent methyltransferase [Bacteroidetes bacterium]|nr:class I SAM-dependent methyltransferase [Bacteroidota bacterium]
MANMNSSDYYRRVAEYYDADARDFEERYWTNPVLQTIRQSLREEVKSRQFVNILEIGFGTGIDAVHFGSIYPDRSIYGIDISTAMLEHARQKVEELGLKNVSLKAGTPEELESLFPGITFDHIYVFFGALNTVHDLQHIASVLRSRMNEGGTMVLTFVNKWYLVDIIIHLLRFRPQMAFRRFRDVWGGYSDLKFLESRCLSPQQVRRAFGSHFTSTGKRGYSILYPAWYRYGWRDKMGRRVSDFLWKTDKILSSTPAWCLGEYALYSFRTK